MAEKKWEQEFGEERRGDCEMVNSKRGNDSIIRWVCRF